MPGLWDVLAAAWAPPHLSGQEQYGANDKIARGVGGLLDQVVGFPKRYMDQYQPGQSVRDNPEATKWGADMALNMVGMPGGVGGLGAGVRLKGFHGSQQQNINKVLADPTSRQFDNATSQFGAFFAPDTAGAGRYGKNLYAAELDLKNPYEMPWSEFAAFQAPNKSNGVTVPPELWGKRAEELKAEAAKLRAALASAGHDGVIVRNRHGTILEIASFNDVPVNPQK